MAKGIITRSNFTIKEPHKKLSDGSIIYERDYMTTTNLGGFDSGSIPWGEGNFKIISSENENRRKRHKSGNWLLKNDCTPSLIDECNIWTLGDLSTGTTVISTENQIIPKPSHNSLLDFVYFGSAVELIKTSISEIIAKYPSELYITNYKYQFIDRGKDYVMGSNILDNPVVVENPFNIDIISQTTSNQSTLKGFNPLRFFADSFTKYMLLDSDDNEICCLSEWEVRTKADKTCYNNGDLIATIDLHFTNGQQITIYAYYFNGNTVLITDGENSGYKLRPKATLVKKIFEEEFSQFQQFLLNRDSIPLYTVKMYTPSETSRGIVQTMKSYTWPILNGWNLDVTSPNYQIYLEGLLSIAEFYDEHNTDNLWKNMTHDSIKNMDIMMETMNKSGEDSDDYIIGTGNIRGLLLAYGRQFDELKLAIENIKTTNTITYDEDDNIPDYFLSDTLNLSGWEVSSVIGTLDKTTTIDDLYQGNSKEYSINDVNVQFMRNLKINSKDIFRRKGTRNAIDMVFSLFGLTSYEFGKNYYESLPETSKLLANGRFLSWDELDEATQAYYYDYKLNEYVVVASNNETDFVDVNEKLPAETYNAMKDDANTELNPGGVTGLPVRIVTLTYDTTDDSGNTTTHNVKYLIPWFDKNVGLDGNPYFQMYGGWSKNENGDYEETKQYLNIVSTIYDLLKIPYSKLTDGQIFYVNDISNISDYVVTSDASNYFRINNRGYCNSFTNAETGNGWYNIPQNDIDNEIKYGIQVVKLENIIETTIGNNPHVGYGKYDSGEEFLNYFRQIFKGAIDNGQFKDEAYDCETGELLSGITSAGFSLTDDVVDNVKCWFFTDTAQSNKIYRIYKKYVDAEDDYGETYNIPIGYEEATYETTVNVGKKAKMMREVFWETDVEVFNFEDRSIGSNDEAAANSIINVKKITIEFNKEKYADNADFKQFLHKAMMPYIKQVIPSTTIMEIINIDSDSYVTEC